MLPQYTICRDIQDGVKDGCRKQKIEYLQLKTSLIMFECVKFVNTLPHIYTMKTLGDWLQGIQPIEAIVQAEIAKPGTADSFLRAAHLTRTRRTHQITAAALFILQRQAYDRWCHMHETDALDRDFEDWCYLRKHAIPQFQYWPTVFELEILLLVYLRSLPQALFTYVPRRRDWARPLVPCLGLY